MAKPLRHVTGVKSSKIEPMDLKDLDKSPDGAKLDAKYHKIEKHADRAGNGDDVYKGTTKEAPYKKAKVAEEVENIDEISKRKVIKYLNTLSAKEKAEREEGKKSQSFPDAIDGTKKPSTYNKKRAVGRSLASEKLIGDARVNATEEVDLDEGNKENKAKKKEVMGDRPKEKTKKEFDPREFFSAARRGRKVDEAAACNHTMEGVMCEIHGESACPSDDKKDYKDKKGRRLLIDKKKIAEAIMNEVAPPDPKIEKWVKANKERFVKEYGPKKGMEVLYATAWKRHGKSESGTSPATETDYAGPGAAGWTTGRHDVGTL